jgi:hypothetical protein
MMEPGAACVVLVENLQSAVGLRQCLFLATLSSKRRRRGQDGERADERDD